MYPERHRKYVSTLSLTAYLLVQYKKTSDMDKKMDKKINREQRYLIYLKDSEGITYLIGFADSPKSKRKALTAYIAVRYWPISDDESYIAARTVCEDRDARRRADLDGGSVRRSAGCARKPENLHRSLKKGTFLLAHV